MAMNIIVDDTDAAILYSPDAWKHGPSGDFPPGSYYNNTFHYLKDGSNGGTVLYMFSGK